MFFFLTFLYEHVALFIFYSGTVCNCYSIERLQYVYMHTALVCFFVIKGFTLQSGVMFLNSLSLQSSKI